VAILGALSAWGCAGPGWYRAIGHFPGVAPSDYAFYYFNGTSSQLFPLSVPQVESSTIEAMADLGFKVLGPPGRDPHGEVCIRAQTPDGRPAKLTVTPQGSLANLRVTIGPVHVGDELLSRDLIRRVGLNYGTLPRDFAPMEPVLARRVNLSRGVPPRIERVPPPPLEGEGLRPDANAALEPSPASGLAPPGVLPIAPNLPQNFVPTRDFPNPPNMPYAPFPYTPFDETSS
jgi:hypothetical protein